MGFGLKNWRIHVLRVPFHGRVHWAAHSEEGVDVILLEVETLDGLRGVSEMAVREKWHGEGVAGVVAALNGQLLPALARGDQSQTSFYETLRTATVSPLARALADMAHADVMAQVQSVSLAQWMAQSITGKPAQVAAPLRSAFSCTITRSTPEAMARETACMIERVGARAFKIKTGQGYERDSDAMAAIRAIASDAFISADSNSAGPPELVAAMSDMLHEHDVRWFEDPCRLQADDGFSRAMEHSRVPVLVDNACRSLVAADAFLGLGAQGLSIKVMKTGLGKSMQIASAAAQKGAAVTIGICASTSLSAIFSLSLYAALPIGWRAMPCEETFFLNLPHDLITDPLSFADGEIVLPSVGPLAEMLNWRAIRSLAIAEPLHS